MNNSFIVGLPNNKKANLGTLSVEANGVYTPTSPVDGFNEVTVNVSASGGDGYVRVTGVPNGEEILANSPDIIQSGVTYKPVYYICLADTFVSKQFTSSYGSNAYIFSDEPEIFYVSGNITHTFDESKDFTTVEGWKCRYVIAYATEANKSNPSGITVNTWSFNQAIEFIGASGTIFSNSTTLFGTNIAGSANIFVRYVDLTNCSFVNNSISANNFNRYCQSLKEIKFPSSLIQISGNDFMGDCSSLTKLTGLDNVVTISGTNPFLRNSSLPSINLPSVEEINAGFGGCYSLSEVKIPSIKTLKAFLASYSLKYLDLSSLIILTGTSMNTFPYVTFIKLPIDFDNSANFTGALNYFKSYEWLNDELPNKLKDNTGETTKTLTIGSSNIARMTAETQTIIANKNWTLA